MGFPLELHTDFPVCTLDFCAQSAVEEVGSQSTLKACFWLKAAPDVATIASYVRWAAQPSDSSTTD